jgi:hypothetical protein
MPYESKRKIETRYLTGWSYQLPWDESFENLEPKQKDEWAKKWLKRQREPILSNCYASATFNGMGITGIRVEL